MTQMDTKNGELLRNKLIAEIIYNFPHFSDKWSPTKIMNNLKGFWKRKDDSITMEKLTSQSNRFVAAGIFFELMGELRILSVRKIVSSLTSFHCFRAQLCSAV